MGEKISIVMSYHNRLSLLETTIKSIKKASSFSDFEIVIVDDASRDDQKLDSLQSKFPEVKFIIHRIEPAGKKHHNPCIPFNMGFKLTTGSKIIIQNPECAWTGDLFAFSNFITSGKYNAFPCYSLSQHETSSLNVHDIKVNYQSRAIHHDGDSGWCNHQIFRPVGYHFASCITKSDLDDLGGFDERYANGHGYDDNEFLVRIQRKGMKVGIDGPVVLHQYHYGSGIDNSTIKQDNGALFHNVTMKETGWKVNQ